jgi:cytochrome P450
VLARLRDEPGLATLVVEELLRYEPTVRFLTNRQALDDIDIAGTTIEKGSPVTLMLAAGSRDPGHVPDPGRAAPAILSSTSTASLPSQPRSKPARGVP